jgi:hypothetical protein
MFFIDSLFWIGLFVIETAAVLVWRLSEYSGKTHKTSSLCARHDIDLSRNRF